MNGLGSLFNLGSSALSLYGNVAGSGASAASKILSNPSTTFSTLPQGASMISSLPYGQIASTSPSYSSILNPQTAQSALSFGSNLNSVLGGDQKTAPIAQPAPAPRKSVQPAISGQSGIEALLASLPPEMRSEFAKRFGLTR